jgi:DNA-binding transcriptional LysR family regulator
MDVQVRDLRYFVAVAERRHFTRAAETLFISQPALSKQIRMLGSQLRTRLLIRRRPDLSR